jgi:hypothetical protein
LLCGCLFRLQAHQRLHDRVQILQKAVSLRIRQARQNPLVDATRQRIVRLQHPCALIRESDGIGTCVVARTATLQQALLEHPPNDISERRTIDAGQLDELCLIESLVLRDREQNGILSWRQIIAAKLDLKHLGGALPGSVQEMKG